MIHNSTRDGRGPLLQVVTMSSSRHPAASGTALPQGGATVPAVTAEAPLLCVDQKTAVRSLSLDKGELRNLLERLQERSLAAGEIEVARFQPRPDETPEGIETARRNIREGFKLWLTVAGVGGPDLTGGIATVFGSPDFPEDVRSVFFDVAVPLQS